MRVLACVAIALCVNNVSAEDKRFQSWNAGGSEKKSLYAGTVNDSGSILLQACFPLEGHCLWMLGNDTGCESGSRYPVLVSSDRGAVGMEIVCSKQADQSAKGAYIFTDFDAFDKIVRNSSRIGIAFPLESGAFQANRFTTDGAIGALQFMRNIADVLNRKFQERSTKDITL